MGPWDYRRYGSADDPVRQSDLDTFARCPRLLRYRRDEEMGLSVIEKKVYGVMVSGTAAHAVLRRALPHAIEGNPVNLTHLRGAYFQELNRIVEEEGSELAALHWRKGASSNAHYRRTIAALFHFLSKAQERIASVECVEVEFRTVIKRRDQEIHAKGTWDIVFRTHQGRLALADYKTGERRPSAFEIDFGFQFGIYAHGMLEGESVEGHRFDAWPDEIWLLMVRDFLPAQRKSSRVVWDRDEAQYFAVRPGDKVKIRKGAQKGPGWYQSHRRPGEVPGMAEAIGNIVGVCRMGKFPKVLNAECQRCAYKHACIQESFAPTDLDPNEKRRLDAALAQIPIDELTTGFDLEGAP